MKISKQARHEAKQLFRSCQVDGLLDETRVRRTVQEVIGRKPRGYFPTLLHFQRLVKLEVARRTAKVESAVRLTEALRSSVQANLNRVYGRGLNLTFQENTALIGGMRVQVGSDVYDGTVQARLMSLREGF